LGRLCWFNVTSYPLDLVIINRTQILWNSVIYRRALRYNHSIVKKYKILRDRVSLHFFTGIHYVKIDSLWCIILYWQELFDYL
jgi:hypothetical protein